MPGTAFQLRWAGEDFLVGTVRLAVTPGRAPGESTIWTSPPSTAAMAVTVFSSGFPPALNSLRTTSGLLPILLDSSALEMPISSRRASNERRTAIVCSMSREARSYSDRNSGS